MQKTNKIMAKLINVSTGRGSRFGYDLLEFDAQITINEASRLVCEGFQNFLKERNIEGKVSTRQTLVGHKTNSYYGIFVDTQVDLLKNTPIYEIISKTNRAKEFLFYQSMTRINCIISYEVLLGFDPRLMLNKEPIEKLLCTHQ